VNGKSYPDSVHDLAYYTNWSLSKTTKKIVSKWDADMIMLPDAYKYKDKILKKNIVRVSGKNIVDLNSLALSETDPIAGFEVRFLKVNKFLFFTQIKKSNKKQIEYWGEKLPEARIDVLTYDKTGLLKIVNPLKWIQVPAILHFLRIKNFIFVKDVYLKVPFFIHTRLVKKRLEKKKYHDEKEAKKYSVDKSKGDRLEGVNIPNCLFKTPQEYLLIEN